uniref:Autophagy-related protein 101 n=1 Tax=Setaria italica TaxID=4555 RepID=K3ZA16_SETIT
MNCETCQLKELELEQTEIRDVLRCILHTIFFHRTLSLVRPKDVDCKNLEITYVCLSFFDEKHKHPGWFVNKTERIYWEQWFINLHVMSPKRYNKSNSSKGLTNIGGNVLEETSSRRAALVSLLNEVLFQIINFANEKKDHIPAIPDRIFNHEIMIPSSSDSVFGWNTDAFRRVLNSGHPYSL